MSFIRKYILPKEVDFNAAIYQQATIVNKLMSHIRNACVENDISELRHIIHDVKREREIKTRNMQQLLDVLITPYDKESIYRIITQLDWIALSVKHFRLEIETYDIHSLENYRPITDILFTMSSLLEEGISLLPKQPLSLISHHVEQILELYDQVVSACANASSTLLKSDDLKTIIRQKDMILQLKEIAKRIHVAANTLEDMAIKVV